MHILIVGLMHGWALLEGGVNVTHVVRKGPLTKHSGAVPMDFCILCVRAVKNALKVLAARGEDYRKYPDTKVFQIANDMVS